MELTTDVTNVASQRVIRANGGQLVEEFRKAAAYGSGASLRFRVPLEVRADEPPRADQARNE